jgi:ApaG protein
MDSRFPRTASFPLRLPILPEGIHVSVSPRFSLARSDPAEGTFVFSYRVLLVNEGAEEARLLFRHWRIHDAAGEDSEVDGEGVVGEQPLIAPGDSHSYSSFCVLRSPRGHMEGHYTFQRPDGRRFRVPVPRFHFEGPVAFPSMDGEDDQPPMH